ncbi:MAG TPA: methyltransferase domain-containing protein [Solirubrobacteraceae bacterium]|nr:methyltransferase domain-containing protein [Solirubrobacteraceae bacterium]
MSERFKAAQRRAWSSGDYPRIATMIESASLLAVERVDAGSGERLLDVATGSGNAALAAARRGAQVTGLDLTPELLVAARERAQGEGLSVEFVEGDAEALPFEDASFDRVTSVFGVIFAPDQPRAAAELLRVCRPGGTVAVTGWTPTGVQGQLHHRLAAFLPPPEGAASPMDWGVEEHVRGLLSDAAQCTCTHEHVTFQADSVEGFVAFNEELLGPVLRVRSHLEPEGRWPEAHAAILDLYGGANEATDGTLRVSAEYLLTLASTA